MTQSNFEQQIQPFCWVEHDDSYSVCLEPDSLQYHIWQQAEQGFEVNGYDWENLAILFLEETHPEWVGIVRFDPEAGSFAAYSSNKETLQNFAITFRQMCEQEAVLAEFISRLQPD